MSIDKPVSVKAGFMEIDLMHLRTKLFAAFLLVAVSCSPALAGQTVDHSPSARYRVFNLTRYVDPFAGTKTNGETYPGATVPFGMIQWSPDTGPLRRPAGYKYGDSLITGFSLDHLSGAGCPYGDNFDFVPLLNTSSITPPLGRAGFLEPFSHANETASPGYYSVKLNDGIKIELTTTERMGFGRFIFPANCAPTVAVNAGSNVNGTRDVVMKIDPENRSMSGEVTGGHFCNFPDVTTIYFYAMFNRPFSGYGTWADSSLMKGKTIGEGNTGGAWVTFDPKDGRTVLVRVAISYVSVGNAKLDLENESPLTDFTSKAFENTARAASQLWNSWLNRIQVSGGTLSEYRTFYTMLYHALLAPTVYSDVNGQYMGYDGKVHVVDDGQPEYADYSGWDIYRSECQLLAMIAPNRASAMAQSLVRDYEQGGAFPRWGVPGMDSGVMIGDPAAAMIADFYAFGARKFDARGALSGLVRAATDPSVYAIRSRTYERPGLKDYLTLGYLPASQDGGNVSMTLEYNSADFALSEFAGALGDKADSILMLKHAQYWKNLFNVKTGFYGMRHRDGAWVPASEDTVDHFGSSQAYVEGSPEQYVWMVPFNLRGLTEKMGGRKIALARLDTFFTEINGGFKSKYAYLGNEPSIETPYIYCFLGEPYKTQQVVRKALNELYHGHIGAYPGNDDLGEMSSWYVFGAIGMYPELPGSDVLVLGSPLFKRAVLHLPGGDVTIIGDGAGKNSPYVHGLTINGREWIKPWIRFGEIARGGMMVYHLDKIPDKKWGSAIDDAPPSYN